MNEQVQEIRYLVGEAWKGTYDAATPYGNANVVQDPTGLSVYRSLKPGNVGHPLTDANWWFCIINLSSIKAESDRIAALNQAIAQDEALRVAAEQLRQQKEAQRVAAETQRNEAEQARINAERQRVSKESQRETKEQQRISAEQGRVTAESARVTAEQARVQAETLRDNAEGERVLAETNRAAAEQQRINAEQTRVSQEQGRVTAEQQRVSDFNTMMQSDQQAFNEAQAARQTAYQTAEGTESGSVAGDGSRWGAFKTNEAARDAKVDAKVADITNLQQTTAQHTQQIAELQSIVADIETIAEGYVRVAGSSSPALSYKSYKYHEQGGFGRESVFLLFYPCLVGTPLTGSGTEGKVLHVLHKFGARTIDGSPKWLDIYGTPHAIDGSEGDVMIVNVEPFYSINGKYTIESTEYDVFLMSRTPFTWQGIEAEHMEKFGWSPDYCVSHTDTDNVVRMHSVYNPAWDGSYQAPVGVAGKYVYTTDPETGDIVETYDANETLLGGAGGLHSTDIDLPTGEQRAMNMNADQTKTVPWMNQTAEGCNRLMSLILAEGGTFDAHNANLMGSGFSSNDPATAAGDWEQAGSGAKNGLRVMDKNGAWKYYALYGNVRFLTGATEGTVYAANVINSWRNPWHILEANRAMSYAIENDVHELEWFVFEGNKYKYRSVQGFNGPSHGEMTCVVWKLIATQAGANAIDPTDNATSIAGNRVEILVSTALVHGMTTQVSPSWWTSGLLFTEDENGQYECFIERDQAELVKGIAADNYDPATPRDFETIYDHVLTVQKGDGYAKNYLNGALMLPDSNANKSGAGLHTYVGKYNYFTGSNASAGKKSVRGFRRGSSAHNTGLSPLTLDAGYSPSLALANFGFGTCCRISE